MNNTYKQNELIKNKSIQFFLILSVTMLFPIFIHRIPSYNNIPIGAILLPMFYISIPAIYVLKDYKLIALGVGFAPILNHLLTGRPEINLMAILTFELIVYTIIIHLILKLNFKWLSLIVGGLSYVLTKLVSSATLLLPVKLLNIEIDKFLIGSISNAFPGILILCVISFVSFHKLSENG